MAKEYVLVTWPKVQELMDYPWFYTECYLMHGLTDQVQIACSYFVPKNRIEELRGTFVVQFTK